MNDVKPHTLTQCLALHFGPACVTYGITYIGLKFFWSSDWPYALLFAGISNVFGLFPVQLGILFFLAKKRGNEGWSLEGVVVNDARMKAFSVLKWAFLILVPTAIIFAVMQPITDLLKPFFDWVIIGQVGLYEGEFPTRILVIALVINGLFTAILVPITEELYFRGYLLPRMPEAFGKSGPVAHSFLFAAYHFDTPWMIPVRTLGLLPLIFVTKRFKSVLPGIVAHGMANSVDIISNALEKLK